MNGRPTRGGYELPAHTDLTNWGVSSKLNWDLGDNLDLTAVLSYRSLDEVHTFDTDGMPIVVEHVINDIENNYFTGEMRLSGTTSFIDWIGGVFPYFDAQGTQHAALIQASTGQQRALFTTYDPTSKAVFANRRCGHSGSMELHPRRPLLEGREGRQFHESGGYQPERQRHPLHCRSPAEQVELEVRG